MQQAHASGVVVYEFDADAVDAFLPLLSVDAATKQAIEDTAKPGRRLRVPATTLTPPAYRPLFGWISYDLTTGGAEYRFQGLFDGGGGEDGEPITGAGVGCRTCGSATEPGGSRVILGRGNYTDEENDLLIPASGLPLQFGRAYHSYFPAGGGHMGPGWIHSYASYIRPAAGGATLVLMSGEWFFADDGAGGFVTPPSFRGRLILDPSGDYLLTYKDGTQWTFDSLGLLHVLQDRNGNLVRLGYDPGSEALSVVIDASGRTALSFAYDGAARLVSVTDAAGRSVTFGHDGTGRLTSVTDALGINTKRFAYDDHDLLVSKTDWNGNVWTVSYDEQGRWTRTVDPLGNSYRALYDYAAHRAIHFDRNGTPTLTELGPNGEAVAVIDALGNQATYTYDEHLNVTSRTTARGGLETFEYDAEDNLVRERSPLGAVTEHTYGPFGRRLTTTQDVGGLNLVTINEYDPSGNVVTTRDASGSITTYAYTSEGIPEAITQDGGAMTTLAFDANGNLTSITDPEGGTTALGYDNAGQLASITDANLHTRSMDVDARGRILSTTNGEGAVTTFSYDAEGNRLTITAPGDVTTATTYDSLNRPVAVEDPFGNVTRTEYDGEGRVLATIDARGSRTQMRYDAIGRLIETRDADGNVTTQAYCGDAPRGSPCEIVDALGNVTRREYGVDGSLLSTTDAMGLSRTFGYDDVGRKTAEVDPDGHLTAYLYDGVGRLVQVTDTIGGVTTYGYDGRGNRTLVNDANGHMTEYSYDLANHMLSETTPLGTAWVYGYDAAGSRVSELDPNGNTTTYEYDSTRRLVRRQYADGTEDVFAYDARGNRILESASVITRTFTYDALDRVTSATDHRFMPEKTLTYSYDKHGNRTSMALSPDGLVTTYRWDRRNLLTDLTDPDGNSTRFVYDTLGRRAQLRYPNGVTGVYEYDERSDVTLIAWRRSTGEVLSSVAYAYDARGNRTSKTYEDGGLESYFYDALNRLVTVTYPAGHRHVAYAYDAVGNRLSIEERTLTDGEQPVLACNPVLDSDCDAVPNEVDNCPAVYNPGQENADGPQFADAFDFSASLSSYVPVDAFAGGSSSTWNVVDGRLTIQTDGGSGDGTSYGGAYLLRSGFDDGGNLRVTAHIKPAASDDGVGIAFRAQDGNNTYRFHENSQRGFQRLEKVSGGTVMTLASTTKPTAPGVEQAFTVEANGPSLRVYQGSALILSAEDADFASGGVGAFAWQAAGSTFDGFVARPIDSRGDACDPCPTVQSEFCAPTCDDPDGDGAGTTVGACGPSQLLADCAPADSAIGPQALESCNGYDDDCDGRIDETCLIDTTTLVYDDDNRLLSSERPEDHVTYAYDFNGNRVSRSDTGQSYEFEYALDNTLKVIKLDGLQLRAYSSDASGMRVAQDDILSVSDANTELYTFGADGSEAIASVAHPLELDSPISYRMGSGTQRYLHLDAVGSVIGTSDPNGHVVSSLRYDVFGRATEPVGEDAPVFAGRPFDAGGAGLGYFRHRYYDPEIGQFTSLDPLLRMPGAYPAVFELADAQQDLVHGYSYAANRPTSNTDPLGLTWFGLSQIWTAGSGEIYELIGLGVLAFLTDYVGRRVGAGFAPEECIGIRTAYEEAMAATVGAGVVGAKYANRDLLRQRFPAYLWFHSLGVADRGHYEAIRNLQVQIGGLGVYILNSANTPYYRLMGFHFSWIAHIPVPLWQVGKTPPGLPPAPLF